MMFPRISYHSLLRYETCQKRWELQSQGQYTRGDPTVFIVGNVLDDLMQLVVASEALWPRGDWVDLAVADRSSVLRLDSGLGLRCRDIRYDI